MAGTKRQAFLSRFVAPTVLTFVFGLALVAGAWAACGDGVLDPGETCDDGNVVNGDGCDDHCVIECPEDLCRCLPNAGKFAVVGGKVISTSWVDRIDEYVQGTAISESICGVTAKLSGRLDGELYLSGDEPPFADAILTSGVGTTAVRFKGYKLDKMPNAGVFIDGDVVTGGGLIQNPQYAEIDGVTDTSGTDPRVATCQQALSELTTASATLASLPPTQTLGTIVVPVGGEASITVGPGRQVVNVDSITIKSGSYPYQSYLDIDLDPATTVLVVNIAKGLSIGEAGVVQVHPVAQVPVVFNFLPGATLKVKKYVDLYVTVLAPTANIKISPYSDDDGFGDLYTTKTVNLKGADVYGYIGGSCP